MEGRPPSQSREKTKNDVEFFHNYFIPFAKQYHFLKDLLSNKAVIVKDRRTILSVEEARVEVRYRNTLHQK